MASFGVGDAIAVTQICYSLYLACTSGRKAAPAAVLALSNELWACSMALDQVSGAISRPSAVAQTTELQETTKRIINECHESLVSLQKLINKYDNMSESHSSREGFRWIRKIQIGIKKSRWMYEENDIQRIRNRIASNVQSLNLLVSAITGLALTSRIEARFCLRA